ncbi:choice-of-anchor A family protein [Streptomyces sp. TRM 70351]|uniref:choice-of-anchor A family protein n=1 Tax=Streptomyces sp. TRM 70351 TaxID=3116552 RepID=UPI002E7C2716|nr:choice-of-anchor A family protein [Streptomyces sp. TRM 70351]MEE1928540.1 choice-of-anchor A family protein [Streptomyces sp. TRM 70351]
MPPRRPCPALAAALAGGALVLALPGPAAAAPACAPQLGPAGAYTEFVEDDSVRRGGSQGAVAVGGDADFTGGLSVAAHPAPFDALPEHATLVVGGTLRNGAAGSSAFTVLERGTAVYGGLEGRPPVLKSGREATRGGPPPVDFAREFARLRGLSERLEALPARGSVTRTTVDGRATVRLVGHDPALNVFPVSATQLADARRVVLTVPDGATAVVNVSGSVYGTDDHGPVTVTGPEGLAGKLLWNFPDAASVAKHDAANWRGTVLAPNAAVDLGSAGHLTGNVIAASLTADGAETRLAPFTGCLDTPLAPPSPAGPRPPGGEDLAHTGGSHQQVRALLFAAFGALTAGAAALWATRRRT